MKNKKYRLGLSILAGGLSFVGAANATDLIVNGSFELPATGNYTYYTVSQHEGDWSGNLCSGGLSIYAGANGWQCFSMYNTSSAYYAGDPIPSSESPGNYYSACQAAMYSDWDHPDIFTTPMDPVTYVEQIMPAYAAQETVWLPDADGVTGDGIDAGMVQYTFSAWLASYTDNPEQPFLCLQFFSNASGSLMQPFPAQFISTAAIFDRCTNTYAVQYASGDPVPNPTDLTSDHQWIKYVATGVVPATAREATVFITRSPNAGLHGTPDTYVDLVKLDIAPMTPAAPVVTTAPTSQTAAVGNSVTFSVAATGLPTPTYQWRQGGTNLTASTSATLVLQPVLMANAGSYDVVVSNSVGVVTSTPPAVLTVINPPVFVTGQWDFLQGNLAASYGADLQYHDSGVQETTDFGTTTSYGISDINGVPTPVMHFTPPDAQWGGYKMYHGAKPNGGGTNVNQYTLIYDVYYPAGSDGTWRSLLQTDVGNTSDGDLFVNPSDGIGISDIYDGVVSAGAWHRLAFAIDLTGTETGTATTPVIAKFIDGVKVGNQTVGLDVGLDGRWSLGPYALLFADNDGDVAETYVSSVQFSNGRRADGFIEALGGPSALKIPGAIKAGVTNGALTIMWTGGVPLQGADVITGPWTTVAGTAGQYTYTPSPLSTAKFYRPQIP